MKRYLIEKYNGAVAPGGVVFPQFTVHVPLVITNVSLYATRDCYFTLYRTTNVNANQLVGASVNGGWISEGNEIPMAPGKYCFGFYNKNDTQNAEMHAILSVLEEERYVEMRASQDFERVTKVNRRA